MEERNKQTNIILATALTLLVWGFFALMYNFYYDMNDDVLIKDILSGTYTGGPDGHNMQMQFMLGVIIASMYRLLPNIPWMGLVEILLMALCFGAIVYRISDILGSVVKKRYRVVTGILLYLAFLAFTISGAGYEIVIIQYTFVCGVLALTAGFLVATDVNESFRIRNNILPLILALLSFNVRSEMFLLMCPFLAVAGMYRWMKEGISRFNVKYYLGFVGIILAGIVLSSGIEKAAYGSNEWKEFREFFDARTQVYDFTGIAGYEGNEDFYASINMSEQDVKYLEEYNFISFPVTTYVMNKVAEYSSSDRAVTTKSHKTIQYAVREYVLSVFKVMLPGAWMEAADDESAFYEDGRISAPYNLILLVLYLMIIVAVVIGKNKNLIVSTLLLLVMRSVSWIYVIYKDRVNARIAHPMYICETLLLIALIVMECKDNIRRISLALVIILSCIYIPATMGNISNKTAIREENNRISDAVYGYTSSNPENYFYLDVYTMTGCSEKIFIKRKYGKGNTQLAGGWIALSPLDDYKQAFYKEDRRRFISRDEIEGRNCVDIITIEGTQDVLRVYLENER